MGQKLFVILPVILLLVSEGDAVFRFRSALAGGVVRDENYDRQYRSNYYKASSSANSAAIQNQVSSRSLDQVKPSGEQSKGTKGLSAWGIVAIVVGVILLGTGGYYAFVFYPYVCRKERKYDMIELTNVL